MAQISSGFSLSVFVGVRRIAGLILIFLEVLIMKAILPILAVGSLLTPALATVLTDNLTPEEQALIDKGMTGELYQPTEHSRRFIGTIEGKQTHEQKAESNNPAPILFFVFGMEDAAPAREEGKTMAEAHYSRQMAHEFLFAEGWDKYHDRFFTRAYVQEGEQAYERASKK